LGKKPKPELENSCFSILVFEQEANARDFLYNHLSDDNVKTMFIKENPNANVTICMPANERKRMMRSAH
jgi:hypothetical protein